MSLIVITRMTRIVAISSVVMFIILLLLIVDRSEGVPRDQLIQLSCNNQTIGNQTVFSQNFILTTEKIGAQVQSSLFGSGNTGIPPDDIFALLQCFGDLSTTDCGICYDAAHFAISRCFPNTGAILYQDGCFMRFQNYSFYDEYMGPSDTRICGNTTTKGNVFESSARQAVSNAVRGALVNVDYFAREEVLATRGVNESVYVLANCWKTLNVSSCRSCLENASVSILQCLPWSEGRVLNTGCFMRYSDTNFLNPVPVRSSSSNHGRMIAVIAAVVSAVVIFIVALLVLLYIRRRRWLQKKRAGTYEARKLAKMLHDSSLIFFKYSTLEKATYKWDESNKLGQGGFGTVYKGVLPDGREIAVKRLFFNSRFKAAEFYNEVNMVNSVEHRNLVRLLGCSCSGTESILVHEYLPNTSLDHFIFDATKGKFLNWEKRFNIIIGTIEGLVYLHENIKTRIIHRDIKAANILLDLRFRPKIADFGLARSFQDDKSHVSTGIAGTLGYMAPEYLAHGQLTEKADVYSFGVLLLEMVTGMENNRNQNVEYTDGLVSTVWKHFKHGTLEEIFDPNLMMHIYPNINYQKEALRVVHVGLLCIQEAPSLRPIMSTVLKMLVENDEPLPAPTTPPFIDEKMELNHITPRLPHLPKCDGDDSNSVATASHSDFYPGDINS